MTALPPVPRATKTFPSASDIRQALLDRCLAYEQASGTARSELSRLLTNDPSFLATVEAGRNIRIDTYEKCMTRLDVMFELLDLHPQPKGRSDNGKKKIRNGAKAPRK